LVCWPTNKAHANFISALSIAITESSSNVQTCEPSVEEYITERSTMSDESDSSQPPPSRHSSRYHSVAFSRCFNLPTCCYYCCCKPVLDLSVDAVGEADVVSGVGFWSLRRSPFRAFVLGDTPAQRTVWRWFLSRPPKV
jgi:hypothetical protein